MHNLEKFEKIWGNIREKGREMREVTRALWKAGLPRRFWLFLFILGVTLGFGAKNLAERAITIGHDDYRLPPKERLYDLNRAKERAMKEGASLLAPDTKKEYPSCRIDS